MHAIVCVILDCGWPPLNASISRRQVGEQFKHRATAHRIPWVSDYCSRTENSERRRPVRHLSATDTDITSPIEPDPVSERPFFGPLERSELHPLPRHARAVPLFDDVAS